MTKKQLQPNAIVIGFRVPIVSNLPQRLKMVVRRTGLSYGELLERWVSNEESILGPLLFEQPQPGSVTQAENIDTRIAAMEKTIADLTTRLETSEEVASLKLQVAELTAKLEALKPYDAGDLTIEHETEYGEDDLIGSAIPILTPYEQAQRRLIELWESGLNNQMIAATLNKEGRATKSGVGQWHASSVSLVIRDEKLKRELNGPEEPDIEVPVDELLEILEDPEAVESKLGIQIAPDPVPDPPRRRGRSKKLPIYDNPSPSGADK